MERNIVFKSNTEKRKLIKEMIELDEEITKLNAKMVLLRAKFAHEYGEIELEKLFDILYNTY